MGEGKKVEKKKEGVFPYLAVKVMAVISYNFQLLSLRSQIGHIAGKWMNYEKAVEEKVDR